MSAAKKIKIEDSMDLKIKESKPPQEFSIRFLKIQNVNANVSKFQDYNHAKYWRRGDDLFGRDGLPGRLAQTTLDSKLILDPAATLSLCF